MHRPSRILGAAPGTSRRRSATAPCRAGSSSAARTCRCSRVLPTGQMHWPFGHALHAGRTFERDAAAVVEGKARRAGHRRRHALALVEHVARRAGRIDAGAVLVEPSRAGRSDDDALPVWKTVPGGQVSTGGGGTYGASAGAGLKIVTAPMCAAEVRAARACRRSRRTRRSPAAILRQHERRAHCPAGRRRAGNSPAAASRRRCRAALARSTRRSPRRR